MHLTEYQPQPTDTSQAKQAAAAAPIAALLLALKAAAML
jgi:hypothetical protein